MLIAATEFILGILSAFYWPEPSLLVCLLVFTVAVPMLTRRGSALCIAAVAFCIAFLWGDLHLKGYYNRLLPASLEGQDLTIKARVTEIPVKRHNGWRLVVEVQDSIPHADIRSLQLNWYSDREKPKSGEVWRFSVRLKRPHGYANPGSFDFEKWMLSRGLHGRGYIRHADGLLEAPSLNLRQDLWGSLHAYPGDAGSLVSALVLGEKHGLSYAQRQLFTDSGTAHLFAISGLHIGMLAGIFYWLARGLVFFSLRFARVNSIFSRSIYALTPLKVCLFSSWLGCIAYAWLAGLSISTQRALIMLSVAYIACALRQRIFSIHSFAIALVLVLIIQPAAVLSAGLFLSFAAVAWIAYLLHVLPRQLSSIKKGLYIQLLLPVCLWPILQFYFGSSATLGALANIVLIPLVGVLLLPMCLIACLLELLFTGANAWLMNIVDALYQLVLLFLEMLNGSTWTQPLTKPLSIDQVLLLQACIALILLPRGVANHLKILSVVLVVLILLPANQLIEKGQFEASVIDVGQGLSILVQTQNHSLLFDSGPEYPSGFSASKAAIVPYLNKQNISKLNKLFLSHGDKDHVGGLEYLLKQVEVMEVFSGQPARITTDLDVNQCVSGKSWQWDGVSFKVLWPQLEAIPGDKPTSNNRSCVLHITAAKQSILLTGDIEKSVEKQLSETDTYILSEVLIAPHHGSNSSSSAKFIRAVSPRIAVFSAAYRSRFGHPHSKVVQRYVDENIATVSTASCGLFTYTAEGVRCFRKQGQQRWQLKKHNK